MATSNIPVGTFSGIRFMDQDDLMSFGGAEEFAFGGQPPVIYENSDRLIVAGRNGVEVMFGDNDFDHYVLAREQMTMSEAIAVIELISHASRTALKAVGFTIGR
jgi:fructose-1,6-bisphosphatase